ncbi:hypothetical protein SNEBB_006694 [Seison nebaliae]|nr:hypothetical protein SNEBB_006694 [Seison nebaliae]
MVEEQASQKTVSKKISLTSKTDEPSALPSSLVPVELSAETLRIFDIRIDDNVTAEDNIIKLPKDLVNEDIFNRGATNELFDHKPLIDKLFLPYMIMIFDADKDSGSQFIVCLSNQIAAMINDPPLVAPFDESKKIEYKPPEQKPWVSYGSEKEIGLHEVKEHRDLIEYDIQMTKTLANRECNFTLVPPKNIKNGLIDVGDYEDDSFDLTPLEMDKEIQQVPETRTISVQTSYDLPNNKAVQYDAIRMSDQRLAAELQNPKLHWFLNAYMPLIEEALQQNNLVNLFENEFKMLTVNKTAVNLKGDLNLLEFQSFSDIESSKDKVVTCISWHPKYSYIIAMAYGMKFPFEDRANLLEKDSNQSYLISIWSFRDPIKPKLFLDAPDDVFTFDFCPTLPGTIVGGLFNGQIAIWDISSYVNRLIQSENEIIDKSLFVPGFEIPGYFNTPIIRYSALSALDSSHDEPIVDLQWIPNHFEINKIGMCIENLSKINWQFFTSGGDNQLLLWDIRQGRPTEDLSEEAKKYLVLDEVPGTYRYLDQVWKPSLKVSLINIDPPGFFAPTKFSIVERQGMRIIHQFEEEEKKDEKPDSEKIKAKLLQYMNTKMYVGTEMGKLVYVDWMPQKDPDSGKIQTQKPEFVVSTLDGPVSAMKRSPYFPEILLVVGGWLFNIWKEKVHSAPLLTSPIMSSRLTDAEWSITRPGIFFIARQDGNIEIWDLTERTNGALIIQNISAHGLTTLKPLITSIELSLCEKQKDGKTLISKDLEKLTRQLVAVGDSGGTLFVFEVPQFVMLPKNDEFNKMEKYFNMETKRRKFVKERWEMREEEKREKDRQATLKAGVGGGMKPLEKPEILQKMKNEYQEYLNFEYSTLRQLGLLDDTDTAQVAELPNEEEQLDLMKDLVSDSHLDMFMNYHNQLERRELKAEN